MIDFLSDGYAKKARLYPGLITLFPPLLTLIAWFPGVITSSLGATLLTLISSCGILYALSVLARSQGKKVEGRLLKKWGAFPTTIWLRHSDTALHPQTKKRYHAYLMKNVPELILPDVNTESSSPADADGAYGSAVQWLKERCRGDSPLVEKENIEYGFRRNLRGMKWIGLLAALSAFLFSIGAIILQNVSEVSFSIETVMQFAEGIANSPPPVVGATLIDALSIFGWTLFVNDRWVTGASEQYARALLAECDRLPQ